GEGPANVTHVSHSSLPKPSGQGEFHLQREVDRHGPAVEGRGLPFPLPDRVESRFAQTAAKTLEHASVGDVALLVDDRFDDHDALEVGIDGHPRVAWLDAADELRRLDITADRDR